MHIAPEANLIKLVPFLKYLLHLQEGKGADTNLSVISEADVLFVHCLTFGRLGVDF